MSAKPFTVAHFFRLGNEAAARESALRIREAEARAAIRIKLANAGLADRDVILSPAAD
jgi:hypothetical protein